MEHELQGFLSLINLPGGGAEPSRCGFFSPRRRIAVARAPGRLDVMGGIADYSGSLVLQLPIAQATFAAAQPAGDGWIEMASVSGTGEAASRRFRLPAEQLGDWARRGYEAAQEFFQREPGAQWAAYVVGVLVVLAREEGLDLDQGLRLLVHSHVPEGKGVSSSAALEVSVMQAVACCFGRSLEGGRLAQLCQRAENHIVGAPCGIMDQMTAALGRAGQLLALQCQPAEVRGFVRVAETIRFWGIDSGIRHAVSGSDYTTVRAGAFMGYRILADLAGLTVRETDVDGIVAVDDPLWRGYLANVDPDEFTGRFALRLPDRMRGDRFLERYGGTTDAVSRIAPQTEYPIRQPTAHPIFEHARVREFSELLSGELDEPSLQRMGELMNASHASYTACGLGCDGTDLLVELVRQHGPSSGLFGAKITGGGSGGTVAILGRSDAAAVVENIAKSYAEQTRRGTLVLTGSSSGACDFGHRWLDPDGSGTSGAF